MKNTSLLILITILAFAIMPANGQLNKLKSKIKEKVTTSEKTIPNTENTNEDSNSSNNSSNVLSGKSSGQNSDYLFMGKNDLDGEPISAFAACIGVSNTLAPMSKKFKQWINDISYDSALKMFNLGRCQVVGFYKDHGTGQKNNNRKYHEKGALDEIAAGLSIYRVETDRLILVEKIAGETYYIIVSGPTNGPPTLQNLEVCGPPQIISRIFHAKRAEKRYMGTNCHDLEQQIEKVKLPSKFAPEMNRTSAVLFTKADYEAQKKNGLFNGKAVYILVDEERLEPVK